MKSELGDLLASYGKVEQAIDLDRKALAKYKDDPRFASDQSTIAEILVCGGNRIPDHLPVPAEEASVRELRREQAVVLFFDHRVTLAHALLQPLPV
jgi:hypothetical protein